MRMKKKFATVLLGATYYALGYWGSHDDCLILEESQLVGGDFHAMLHPARMENVGEKEEQSELGKLMREYGVWTEKGFDLLKAAPVAHEYAARQIQEGKAILLDCRLLGIRLEADAYVIRYFCNEGICEVRADQVIDTTISRISAPDLTKTVRQTLNAFTIAQEPGFDEKLWAVCPDIEILSGFNENEKLLRFPAQLDETIVPAYQRMVGTWKKAFPAGEEKLLFVADTLDAVYESTGDGIAPWNGGRFQHPVSAYVKGGEAQ